MTRLDPASGGCPYEEFAWTSVRRLATVAGDELMLLAGSDAGIEVSRRAVDAAHPPHDMRIADHVAACCQVRVGRG